MFIFSYNFEVVSRNIVANIDGRNKWGWTPLMRACRKGSLDVVKVLVKVYSLFETMS